MLVFSVEAEPEASAGQLPKSEFSTIEKEALKLAAEGKEVAPEEPAEGEGEAEVAASPGAEVFTQNCATCHTLAAAGAKGTVGPNLDQLKPSESTVEKQVINGGGAMPAFGTTKILTPKEIKEVSKFVAAVAGGQEPAH